MTALLVVAYLAVLGARAAAVVHGGAGLRGESVATEQEAMNQRGAWLTIAGALVLLLLVILMTSYLLNRVAPSMDSRNAFSLGVLWIVSLSILSAGIKRLLPKP